MARTERQIAEHMAHYISTPDKYAALEALARCEKKTETEIIEICERNGVRFNTNQRCTLPEEKREEIRAALREGLTLTQAAERCKVSSSACGRIRLELVKNGELLPRSVGGRKATQKYKREHPESDEQKQDEKKPASFPAEAYPGQIVDEPIVEEDVKIFLPSETAEKTSKVPAKMQKNSEEPWKALAEQIARFAAGTFGSGTKITSVYWNSREANADAEVVTVDGKIYLIQLEEIGHE